jgi:hypothetical protein
MYKNNPESDEKLFTELYKDRENFLEIIEKYYPTWIQHRLDNYSLDYPHLQKNWEILLEKANKPKRKILLVDEMNVDEDHTTILTLCEILAREGFIVRRTEEFFPCSICNSALPTKTLYKGFKKNGITVPKKWMDKCKNC